MAAFCARVQLDFENDNTLLLAVTDPSVGGAVNNARLAAVGRAVVTAALTESVAIALTRICCTRIQLALSVATAALHSPSPLPSPVTYCSQHQTHVCDACSSISALSSLCFEHTRSNFREHEKKRILFSSVESCGH